MRALMKNRREAYVCKNEILIHRLFPQIKTIKTMIQNPHYQKLADLYLDNNSISTVKELEGSEWFTSFRVLSLRGNLLKQVRFFHV